MIAAGATAPVRGDAAAVAAAAGSLLAAAAEGTRGVLAAVVDPPALVLGSAQPSTSVDEAACARAGVPVVRRGSGGGAVLCDANLLEVDVALPPGHPWHVPDVTESYRAFGEAWAAALQEAGVAVRLVGVEEARVLDADARAAARLACWAGLSPYEVLTADGRKLVGLSQRRRGGAVLLQAGVACSGSPARVLDLLRIPPALRSTTAAALARTAALDEVAGPAWADPGAVWARVAPRLLDALAR